MADLLSALGSLRYGVPTAEKERLARTGELPGAPKYDPNLSDEENIARADRYAAGYLFGKEHPTASPLVQALVNRIKTSDLPFLGGSSPELQSFAQQGVNLGTIAAHNAAMPPPVRPGFGLESATGIKRAGSGQTLAEILAKLSW